MLCQGGNMLVEQDRGFHLSCKQFKILIAFGKK